MSKKDTRALSSDSAKQLTNDGKVTQNEADVTGDFTNPVAPIEKYRGEPVKSGVNDVGDLEEETLDEGAPFNKTYGIEKREQKG